MSEWERIKKTIATVGGFLAQDNDEQFARDFDKREGTSIADQLWGAPQGGPPPAIPSCRFCQKTHPPAMACAVAAAHAEQARLAAGPVDEAPPADELEHGGRASTRSSTVETLHAAASSAPGRRAPGQGCIWCGNRRTVTDVGPGGVQTQIPCPKCPGDQ